MKYYIWALGCAMNKSDAERIASVLCDAGFKETSKESEADVVVTVACSVRQSGINRIYGKIKEWQDIRAKRSLITILSGCVLAEDKKKMGKFFDLIFEINEISKLTNFLPSVILDPDPESIKSGSRIKYGMTNDDFFQIHPKYNSEFQAYVPISTGCNNFCTYCAVPYTRGREISRPMDGIIAEIQYLVKNDYKEVTLLGQNVNSYGNDLPSPVIPSKAEGSLNKRLEKRDSSTFAPMAIGESVEKTNHFVKLLKRIDKTPGDYRVYFYSNHPKDMSDELIEALAKLNHFPHYIHLPLQSGSDKILKAMNRHYTQEQYLELVEKIRESMPDVAITTDVIVGFPDESEEDFEQTKKVMEKVEFSMPFIAKYSPRSGTVAAKMKNNVSKEEKERRWRELTDVQKKILEKENKKLVGKNLRILVDSEKKGKYYGRTDSYKIIEIPKKQTGLTGQFVNVEIIDSSAWVLKGKIN